MPNKRLYFGDNDIPTASQTAQPGGLAKIGGGKAAEKKARGCIRGVREERQGMTAAPGVSH